MKNKYIITITLEDVAFSEGRINIDTLDLQSDGLPDEPLIAILGCVIENLKKQTNE